MSVTNSSPAKFCRYRRLSLSFADLHFLLTSHNRRKTYTCQAQSNQMFCTQIVRWAVFSGHAGYSITSIRFIVSPSSARTLLPFELGHNDEQHDSFATEMPVGASRAKNISAYLVG